MTEKLLTGTLSLNTNKQTKLIYIFFFLCGGGGGEGTISVIYWETHFILLFVRVGIFFWGGGGGGGGGGDTEVGTFGKISERPHHTHKPALLYNVTKLVVSPHSKFVKFKLPHPLIKTFWTTGAGQNPFTVSGRLILSSTVFIS